MARNRPTVVGEKMPERVGHDPHCQYENAQMRASKPARPRGSGDPDRGYLSWIPACAGMSGKSLRRLHVGKELPHFRFQVFRLDRDRIGEVLDVGGGRAGIGGDAGDLAHRLGSAARLAGGAADALRDRGHRGVLLIDGGRHHGGDRRHFTDDGVDLFDRARRVGGGRLDRADLLGDLLGRFRGLPGQRFHFRGNHRETLAGCPGSSGEGFAVVASEVKSLAGQTAKATEEIAEQIGSIQSAAADAARAIEQVNAIIREMSAIATMVAATVDQQNSAVASITEGVSRASGEARSGAEAMSKVAGVTTDARSTASDVKDLADAVAVEAENLEAEVRQFLTNVQAA